MPRSPSGDYTLPPGNPVATGTTIESSWANDTMADIAAALTASLSRNGQGGMLSPVYFQDGTQSAPGIAFTNETTLGFARLGAGVITVTKGLNVVGSATIPNLVEIDGGTF